MLDHVGRVTFSLHYVSNIYGNHSAYHLAFGIRQVTLTRSFGSYRVFTTSDYPDDLIQEFAVALASASFRVYNPILDKHPHLRPARLCVDVIVRGLWCPLYYAHHRHAVAAAYLTALVA